MKTRYLAILLAAAMLLPLSGCGKTTTVSTPDSTPAAESTAENSSPDLNAQGTAPAETDENGETLATDETSAEAAPGQTQAATPSVPLTADDDQMGELGEGGGGAGGSTPGGAAASGGDTASGGNTGSSNSTNDKLHITVETAEVTVDQLKAQDYVVPLVITLDKNPGISYSEWGLKLDDRCTYDQSSKGMDFSTVGFISAEKHFLWTAWTSGAELTDYDGTLLTLYVTVPRDATPGTTYKIEYADWSKNDTPHIWAGGDNDWVKQDAVGWTDGGVVVK